LATLPSLKRSFSHLHIFGISLGVIVLALFFFLFAVTLEAKISATGIVTARDIVEIRTRRPGLIEPGWYDDEAKKQGFHALKAGDELKSGQLVMLLYPQDIPPKSEDDIAKGAQPILRHAPETAERWLVLDVSVATGQSVPAGTLVATLVPIDQEKKILDLMVRLDIDEKHVGELKPGLTVRFYSTMYPHRIHGVAEGVLERLEPRGEAGENGVRRFHAIAKVSKSPFPLKIGSSVKAEILIGEKPTYRIILEH